MRTLKSGLPLIISLYILFVTLDTLSAHAQTTLSPTVEANLLPASQATEPILHQLLPETLLASLPRQQQVGTYLPRPVDMLITEFITRSGWRTPGLVPVNAAASRHVDMAINPNPDMRSKHIVWNEQNGRIWYIRLGPDDAVEVPATDVTGGLPTTNGQLRIAVDADNNAHIVYTQFRIANTRPFYIRINNDGTRAFGRDVGFDLPGNVLANHFSADIAVNPLTNNVMLVTHTEVDVNGVTREAVRVALISPDPTVEPDYHTNPNANSCYTHDSPEFQPTMVQASVQGAIDTAGFVHAVWLDRFGGSLNLRHCRFDNNENLANDIALVTDILLNTAIAPDLTAGADNHLHLVWNTGDPATVMYTQFMYDGIDFTTHVPPTALSNSTLHSRAPSVAATDNNRAFVTWNDTANGLAGVIHFAELEANGDIVVMQELSSAPWSGRRAQMATDDRNRPHIVWNDSADGTEHIWFTKRARRPLIFLPGIGASHLQNNNGDVWVVPDFGNFRNASEYMRLNEAGTGPISPDPEYQLVARDVTRKVLLFIDFYQGFFDFMEEQGYQECMDGCPAYPDENGDYGTIDADAMLLTDTLFALPYDWRFSNEMTADRVDEFVTAILQATEDNEVEIVAHSMGGIVAREYMNQHGNDRVYRFITIGTPWLGAAKAYKAGLHGDSLGNPFFSRFMNLFLIFPDTRLMARNLPALYELMPSQSYYDFYDGTVPERPLPLVNNARNGWPRGPLDYANAIGMLTDPDLALVNANLLLQAALFHDGIDDWTGEEDVLPDIHIITAQGRPTVGQVMTRRCGWGSRLFAGCRQVIEVDGDSTVPFFSASRQLDVDNDGTFELDLTGGAIVHVLTGVSKHASLPSDAQVHQLLADIMGFETDPAPFSAPTQIQAANFDFLQLSVNGAALVRIVDENGNFTGLDAQGFITTTIPNSEYEVDNSEGNQGEKIWTLATLPSTGTYTITLSSSLSETLTLTDGYLHVEFMTYDAFTITDRIIFSAQTLNKSGLAEVVYQNGSVGDLLIDQDNDGDIDEIIPPYADLGIGDAEDFTVPASQVFFDGQPFNPPYTSTVVISITASDSGSGVNRIEYSFDEEGQTAQVYNGPFTVDPTINQEIWILAVDNADNWELPQTYDLIPEPVADFTGVPRSGFVPLNTIFTDTSTGLINNWIWHFGDGMTSTVQNPSHIYTATGVYTVSLMVSGPGGSDTLTRTNYITVTAAPPTADFAGAPLVGTAPLTVTFTDASSGEITAYLWNFGDGITSTVQNPSHTYTAAGVYTVSLTVSGPGGSDSLTRTDYITVNEPPPVADFFGAPLTGAAPLTVIFTNTSTGAITSYLWDFGDGITSTLPGPDHTYAAPGLYTVSLTVSGPGGSDSLTRTDYITVNEPPPVADFFGAPLTGVAPLTVIFTSTSTGAITSYLWDFGDGITSTLPGPDHTYATPGLYTVSLTVSGPGGSDSLTRTDYITVNEPAPVADFFGAPLSGIAPFTVVFTNTSTGAITSYLWDFGDGITSTLQNPSHTYGVAGLYTVSLTVSGPGGSDSLIRTDYVTVNESPPVAGFTGSPLTGTAPLAVTFTSTSTGAITAYQWDFGDGITSTVQNPSHTYTATGVYTVSLMVSGPGGSDSLTRPGYITVNEPPPAANFSGAPLSGSVPLTVTFTDASVGNIISYLWDFGDGLTSTVSNPVHIYMATGIYTVSLTVSGPGGSDTFTRPAYITVADLPPTADFFGTPLSGTVPFTVTFTDTSTGAITSYLWDFGDGITSTVQNPAHFYTSAGLYSVSLTVSGPVGSDTLTRTNYITVTPQPPTPDFTGTPRTGNAPLTVTFTDLTDQDIFSWLWDFGDGITSTVQHPVYTYTTTGVYTVSLTVTGPGGSNTLTRPDYITVTVPPPVANFQAEPVTGSPPLVVNFTDLSTGQIDTYLWDFGDGLGSNAANPTHVYTATGVYTVSLTVTGPGGTDMRIRSEYIAVEVKPEVTDVIYVSADTGGTVDGLTFADEDILAFDSGSETWSLYFDGSDVGLAPVDVNAFTLLADGSILLSLDEPFDVGGNGREVDDSDIVRFVPTTLGDDTDGTFELYFRGANVGLTTDAESIDAVALNADGHLLISTAGAFNVGAVSGAGEDLLLFKPESLGNNTSGEWEFYFDGSDVGLADTLEETVWGAWLDNQTKDIYLTARGAFAVPGLSGDGADIFICTPISLGNNTQCDFGSSLFWDGSAHGFGGLRVDDIAIALATTAPVANFEASPTEGVLPLSVNFTDLSTGDITTWAWEFGDGVTSTMQHPDHTYLTDGLYTVTLTVSGPGGTNTYIRTSYITVVEPEVNEVIYVSADTGGMVGSLAFADEDILAFDIGSETWSLYFDGSDVGLAPVDVDAFTLLADGSILLSLDEPFDVDGNGREVDDSAILRFVPTSLGDDTSGTFELYFNGATVGLTTANEDIDAIGLSPEGHLLISTLGAFSVGTLSGADEDLLLFRAESLGQQTSGDWEFYFDGSDVGLADTADEDVWGTWVDAQTQEIYLTTQGVFAVPGLSGDGADIFICTPNSIGNNTQCDFGSSLFWDGSAHGFGGLRVDGFAISLASIAPVAHLEASPTNGTHSVTVNSSTQLLKLCESRRIGNYGFPGYCFI